MIPTPSAQWANKIFILYPQSTLRCISSSSDWLVCQILTLLSKEETCHPSVAILDCMRRTIHRRFFTSQNVTDMDPPPSPTAFSFRSSANRRPLWGGVVLSAYRDHRHRTKRDTTILPAQTNHPSPTHP